MNEQHPFPKGGPDKSGGAWVWEGVDADVETVARLQPRWNVPEPIAIKADIGHHFHAPDVIREAIASIRSGACAVHLHIRDDAGADTGDPSLWRKVVGAIREENREIVIDSGLRGRTFEEQMSHVREGLFDIVPIVPCWDAPYLKAAIEEIQSNGAKAEVIAWDTSDILLAKAFYIDTGLLKRPTAWLIVPQAPYRGMPMTDPLLMTRGLLHMVDLVKSVDPDAVIMVSASGRASSYLTTQGVLWGLHVRPGIGETLWRYPHKEEILEHNETALNDAIVIARALGRRPATPGEYRELIGL